MNPYCKKCLKRSVCIGVGISIFVAGECLNFKHENSPMDKFHLHPETYLTISFDSTLAGVSASATADYSSSFASKAS